MTSQEIIEDYHQLKSLGLDTWLSDCARTKDVLLVIEMAALARNIDKEKHPHQYRVPNHTLREFANNLIKTSESVVSCRTFEELYETVNSARIAGIGDLTVYDTSQRIGARLKLLPRKVYLHQGTRVGAERYLGRKINVDFIDKSEFIHFRHLKCSEIEDILCIYKDSFPFKNAGAKKPRSRMKC